jgi:hypothetical protein
MNLPPHKVTPRFLTHIGKKINDMLASIFSVAKILHINGLTTWKFLHEGIWRESGRFKK